MSKDNPYQGYHAQLLEKLERLERENAKLHAEVKVTRQNYETYKRENAALRAAAVEVCILARVWVTVWGDKLSTESIQRFVELEKQILKEAQP